jgi:hypothetical protein
MISQIELVIYIHSDFLNLVLFFKYQEVTPSFLKHSHTKKQSNSKTKDLVHPATENLMNIVYFPLSSLSILFRLNG